MYMQDGNNDVLGDKQNAPNDKAQPPSSILKVGLKGLLSDIKSEDPSVDFTFLPPGHWTYSFMCHFNYTEGIQSCGRFGALNLSYTLLSLSYEALIFM